jgi:hypothetical protein
MLCNLPVAVVIEVLEHVCLEIDDDILWGPEGTFSDKLEPFRNLTLVCRSFHDLIAREVRVRGIRVQKRFQTLQAAFFANTLRTTGGIYDGRFVNHFEGIGLQGTVDICGPFWKSPYFESMVRTFLTHWDGDDSNKAEVLSFMLANGLFALRGFMKPSVKIVDLPKSPYESKLYFRNLEPKEEDTLERKIHKTLDVTLGEFSLDLKIPTSSRALKWTASSVKSCIFVYAGTMACDLMKGETPGTDILWKTRYSDSTNESDEKLIEIPEDWKFGSQWLWCEWYEPERLLDRFIFVDYSVQKLFDSDRIFGPHVWRGLDSKYRKSRFY